MIVLAIPPGRGLATAQRLARGLLVAILLTCATVAAVAWELGSTTVAALCLVIAAEETLEISVVLAALRRGERRRISDPVSPAADGGRAAGAFGDPRPEPSEGRMSTFPRAPRLLPTLRRNLG